MQDFKYTIVMKKPEKIKIADIPVSFFREGEYYIAYSPVLDIATQALTLSKVKKRFNEALNIFFEECATLGTIEENLLFYGWQKIGDTWQPPQILNNRVEKVAVNYTFNA